MKTSTLLLVQCLSAGVVLAPVVSSAQWSNYRKANAVTGQSNFTNTIAEASARTFHDTPTGIAIDPATGKLFVADKSGNRVLRFSSAAAMSIGAPAEIVLGQSDFEDTEPGTTQFKFIGPRAVHVDSTGTLWVADTVNHRVLRFDDASTIDTGAFADAVLGKTLFNTPGSVAASQSSLFSPRGLTVDHEGNLWVADFGNNRVMMWEDAKSKGNGAPADLVLGQANFTGDQPDTAANRMYFPSGVTVRRVSTFIPSPPAVILSVELWVTDSQNHRVLKFDDAADRSNGDSADGVIGQPNLTTAASGVDRDSFDYPETALVDGDALWVVDQANNRALRFEGIASLSSVSQADYVLGQPDFFTKAETANQRSLFDPSAAAVDADGNLWICDSENFRVVRYSPGYPRPDLTVGKKRKKQKGNNRYNNSAAGQKIRVRALGKSRAKVFFTVQNDGPYDDRIATKASRSGRKIDIKWFARAGKRKNVTARIVRGSGYKQLVPYASKVRLQAKVRFLGKAKKTISVRGRSLENGARDKVKAKIAGGG